MEMTNEETVTKKLEKAEKRIKALEAEKEEMLLTTERIHDIIEDERDMAIKERDEYREEAIEFAFEQIQWDSEKQEYDSGGLRSSEYAMKFLVKEGIIEITGEFGRGIRGKRLPIKE